MPSICRYDLMGALCSFPRPQLLWCQCWIRSVQQALDHTLCLLPRGLSCLQLLRQQISQHDHSWLHRLDYTLLVNRVFQSAADMQIRHVAQTQPATPGCRVMPLHEVTMCVRSTRYGCLEEAGLSHAALLDDIKLTSPVRLTWLRLPVACVRPLTLSSDASPGL